MHSYSPSRYTSSIVTLSFFISQRMLSIHFHCLPLLWHLQYVLQYLKVKRLKVRIALYGNPSQSYGASLAIWDHAMLPVTRHKWTRPDLTPASQVGTRFTYSGVMEGWVDLGSLIAARLGIEPTTAWSQVRRPNRYATRPGHQLFQCSQHTFVWQMSSIILILAASPPFSV